MKHKQSLDVKEVLRQLDLTFEQWKAFEAAAAVASEEGPLFHAAGGLNAVQAYKILPFQVLPKES